LKELPLVTLEVSSGNVGTDDASYILLMILGPQSQTYWSRFLSVAYDKRKNSATIIKHFHGHHKSVIWQFLVRNQVFGEININNCNLVLGLHRDRPTPIIQTLKKISASGAMFNETVLNRMQNIITFKMIGKSTNDDSFQYLRKDTSERNWAII